MKTKVKLTDSFLSKLPAELTDNLQTQLRTSEVEEPVLKRQAHAEEMRVDDDRSIVGYASTRHVDRDQEVVIPSGMDLTAFKKAPHLLWNHKWSEPPIGHDNAIGSDGMGLVARSLFAETSFANEIWSLVRGKHLRTSSIGFVTLEYIDQYHPKFGSTIDMMRQLWPEFDPKMADSIRGIHMRAALMEHSIVSVAANPEALVIAISEKSLDLSAKTLGEFGIDVEVVRKGGEHLPVDPVEDPEETPVEGPPEPSPQPEEDPVEPVEPVEKSCRLVARLVCRPSAPVVTERNIAELVKEHLDLQRGRI